MKSLVLLDVDGVINSFWGHDNPEGYHVLTVPNVHGDFDLYIHDDTRTTVQRLVDDYDVMWCSTWRHEANGPLTDYLGIRELEAVTDGGDGRFVSWKWEAALPIVQAAVENKRRVLWIEDFAGSHLRQLRYDSEWKELAGDLGFYDTAETGYEMLYLPDAAWEWLDD